MTIITTAPNDVMKRIHNRMPVVLQREDEEKWQAEEEMARIVGSGRPTAADTKRRFDEFALNWLETYVKAELQRVNLLGICERHSQSLDPGVWTGGHGEDQPGHG